MQPEDATASLLAQIAHLQTELDSLRARYDTLLEAKNRAAERYKADYKKWRDFKRWLFDDAETDDRVKSLLNGGELAAYMKASMLGKRKQLEEFGPTLDADGETNVHKQESIEVVPPCPSPSPHKHQRSKSCSETLFTGDNDSLLANLDDKPSLHDQTNETPCKAETTRPLASTEPRKRRGRYAQVPTELDTINSRFSIRKDRNDGIDFQFDAVVRNRQERKRMLGSDCECCREYYEAVGPLPPSRQPLWRTPTKHETTHHFHASENDKENTDEMDEHKQLISRHRHHWHRPKTPPGYWDIGFPDSQEVLDINRRAAEMHKRKFVQVETEAMNSNGRYIERTPRTS